MSVQFPHFYLSLVLQTDELQIYFFQTKKSVIMEDYIFIILAIALSIVGAINQNKKKKATGIPSGDNKVPNKTSFFDQFIEESVFGEEPINVQNYVPDSELQTAPVQTRKSIIPEPFLNPESEGKKNIEPMIAVKRPEASKSKKQSSDNKNVLQIMNGFTLKKAFVYSEIIQRKY